MDTRTPNTNTEAQIKDAAMRVFIREGFDGARMQHIADEAGISKAMLHYYFKSKENLFDKVFADCVIDMIPAMEAIATADIPFVDKIKLLVRKSMEQYQQAPELNMFIFRELSQNFERLRSHIEKIHNFRIVIDKMTEAYADAVAKGEVKSFSPHHLLWYINSLVDYLFISRPFFQTFMGLDDEQMNQFLLEHGQQVELFILAALRPDTQETKSSNL